MNICLICAVSAWIIAQLIKTVRSIFKHRRFDFVSFWSSGGMPSSHSSTVTALATSCGYLYGFSSGVFAVACVLALIVMYDAAGVRRAVGEQAKILNKITATLSRKERVQESDLKELVGHTPMQVFFGGLLGIAIGFLFPFLLGGVYAN